jgi:hypothetical protein
LIDWVHFALLRALKSQLEDFANEGDPSAVHCIRNLNWELLDLATWPIYLAEYLLTRGTELRYGMKLTDLKLLSTEYYRQPAVVKLELLRALSDDVLEIGAIRSRMSELDGNDEGFRSTGLRRKKRGSSAKGQRMLPSLQKALMKWMTVTVMNVIFVAWMVIYCAAMAVQLPFTQNVWGWWRIYCLKVIGIVLNV